MADLLLPMFTPFDPAQHTAQDVGHGAPSTEYIMTEQAPDGGFWNIPSIWWNDQNVPTELPPLQAQMMAREYEKMTGKRFPRYDTPGMGAEHAMHRSAMGGATKSPLAR